MATRAAAAAAAAATAATATATATAAASSGASRGVVRCTRRIRDPLNYLIMQPTDADQITTSIRTTDVALVTWYVPVNNLQHCLHRRYEAEQFGELVLPAGTAPPRARALTPTQEELGAAAAATHGPTVGRKLVLGGGDLHGHNNLNNGGGGGATPFSPPTSPLAGQSSDDAQRNRLDSYVDEATSQTIVPLGLVTLTIGSNIPEKQGRIERFLDPAPHPTISLRVMALDRIHWQRTSWVAGSVCKSLCWGRLPQRIFSINLDFEHAVVISGGEPAAAAAGKAGPRVLRTPAGPRAPLLFDDVKDVYRSPYQVEVPGLGFKLVLQDTARTLFDPRARVTDGFLDNESALHRLALTREVNMLGLGGSVYRQTLWSSPALPNLAKVVHCEFGSLFERYFGCSPVGEPVATWLVREVPKTLIYQMEGEVEDENDPNSATTYGDRSLTERVQKKAMNRYNGFRDDIRGKSFSEMKGEETPR